MINCKKSHRLLYRKENICHTIAFESCYELKNFKEFMDFIEIKLPVCIYEMIEKRLLTCTCCNKENNDEKVDEREKSQESHA